MSGQRCPSCGEDDLTWVEHNPPLAESTVELDEDGEQHHVYCTNCDYGLCSADC